ncbi:MAG: histidine kinase [Lentimicrobiaceae bacterium]|jgi:LytS/YehU family sensor histidine kinase|nr:histidine kinase [Lentimicrobiaceae bacterium]
MNEINVIASNFYELFSVGISCNNDFAAIDTTTLQQIESINSRKIGWCNSLIFLTLLVAGLVITYFISRSIVNARKKKEAELALKQYEQQLFFLKQRALQIQMNPHMLFNALNSIQLYIVINDTDNALKNIIMFSKFLRRILSNASKKFVTIEEEIDAIRLYLDIEHLRFGGRFDFDLEIDSEIDVKTTEIPSMILQPYIDNAINHGLMHIKGRKGLLHVKFEKQSESVIMCIIQDNGVGRKKAIEIKENSGIVRTAKGMQVVAEQLNLMNRYAQGQYTIHITDLYDNQNEACGTRVEIKINAKNNDSMYNS